ncbi:MAG: DNA polymerase [Thermoplasmata archaeon]
MSGYKVFDIEAYDWNEIYAIGIYDGNSEPIIHYTVGRSKNRDITNFEFIDWLFSYLHDNDVVYAHNGGKYDFLFIMDYVSAKRAELVKLLTINGSIVSMIVKKDGKTITFKDSYHILPASLLRLTNDFDVKHKKLKMDYDLGVKDPNFENYFKNDLMGLYEVLKESNLTEKLTIASNAIDFYKKLYKSNMTRNADIIDNFFREAYYGGRVEVVKHVGTYLNYYDVNSLYPYVMSKYEYPLPEKDNFYETYSYVKGKLGIYECEVEAPDMYIPVLPVKHNGKLIFPVGKFSGVWCSPELDLAIEKGYKIKVKKGYVFIKTANIFKDYVDYWYNIKKNSLGAKKAVAKLMLNSLYGKFGKRRLHSDLVPVFNKIPDVSIVYGNIVFEQKDVYDSHSMFLHSEIAAFVTSYARVHLYRLMEKVGLKSIYYYDTDSIITSTTCQTSNELGDLKEEAKITNFIALAPKLYAYTSGDTVVIKAKGLRVSQLKFSDFEKAYKYKDYSGLKSEFTKIMSLKEGIKYGNGQFTKLRMLRRSIVSADSKRVETEYGDTAPVKL